jgi:thymidylate synthase
MDRNFNTLEPQFGYKVSYGERIWGLDDDGPFHDALNVLRRKPEAKSATIPLVRTQDLRGGHVPCIAVVDLKIRGDRLALNYFARSQDVFKKSYADNLALHHVQRKAAELLGVRTGPIAGFIASAHIYHTDLVAIQRVHAFQKISR